MDGNMEMQSLLQQLNESRRKIELIREVTFELNKVSSLPDKLNNILEILHNQFFINYSMIFLPDEQGQQLIVQSSYGYEKNNKGFEVAMGAGVAGLAALKKIPINITGIRRKKQYLAATSEKAPGQAAALPGLSDPESQIAIPLVSNNELVAVLMAESYNVSVFSKEDEDFLITLSQSIAVSIQNSHLFDTMEDIIAKRTEQLRKSNHTKDRLFSIISHDLKGPIGSFHTIAKLVSHYNRLQETEKIDLLSQRIDQSVHKLNTLLDNLLDWALTQTGEIQYRPENIDLSSLLHEITGIYSEQLLLKKIHLTTNYLPGISAYADYHMLTTICRNLLSNAIKYTPRNGHIAINVMAGEKEVRIEFADTGVGMPADMLATIFEPNEKKSTRGTENEKGTGLGLLVAREFSQLNKGSMIIESEPMKGTRVILSLPLC